MTETENNATVVACNHCHCDVCEECEAWSENTTKSLSNPDFISQQFSIKPIDSNLILINWFINCFT